MIQAHINAGGWNLTDDMGPLDEVNIYETRYGNDQRLTLKPLTRHPIKLDDVFRWAYSSLWLESLGEYDHCDNSRDEAAMVELMWQDYDCGGIDEIVEPLRYKIEVVKDLIKLSREGTKATTSLIKMLHSRPSSKKIQALGDKISGIDETLNKTGCAHPEIKPVIDLFVKRKENFQGDDVVRLGKDTLRCYE